MNTQVLETTAGLLDLSDMPLDELLRAEGDTSLDEALRRAVGAAAAQPPNTVSAFNSAI